MILQSMLFCRHRGQWDEVPCVGLFCNVWWMTSDLDNGKK